MVQPGSMASSWGSPQARPEELLASIHLKDLHHVRSDGNRLWAQLINACQVPSMEGVFSYAARHHPAWCLDYVAEVCGDRNLTSNDPLEAQLLDGTFVKTWCNKSLQAIEQQLSSTLQNDASLQQINRKQAEQDLSVAGVIVNVLKALECIRSSAADQQMTDGSAMALSPALNSDGAASSSGGMAHAVQLQRALSLLLWCLDRQVHRAAATGVHASLPDWTRHVQTRREKRVTDAPLFLDDLLQALSISGSYPFKSPSYAMLTLTSAALASVTGSRPALMGTFSAAGFGAPSTNTGVGTARWWDAEIGQNGQQTAHDSTWHACCALLLYYLTDLGVLQPGTAAGDQLLSSFSAAFHIPLQQVATCCAAALLDEAASCSLAALPATAGSPAPAATTHSCSGPLQYACELLQKHSPTKAHIKLLKVLCNADCADVALLLHRAQTHPLSILPSSDPAKCVEDAWALVHIRLRCGLLAEALSLMRTFVAASHSADSNSSQARAAPLLSQLLRGIMDWAMQAGPAGGASLGCSNTLMLELCCSPEEEEVLVNWLLQQLDAGKPVSHLLPIIMASRGRAPEALGAFNLWRSACCTHPQLSTPTVAGATMSTAHAVEAVVEASAEGLPAPLRNISVLALDPAAGSGPAGPAALLPSMALSVDAGMPMMVVEGHIQQDGSWLPPVLAQTAIPPRPVFAAAGQHASGLQQQAAATAAAQEFAAEASNAHGVQGLLTAALPSNVAETAGGPSGGFMFGGFTAGTAAAIMPTASQAPPLGSLFTSAADPAPAGTSGMNMSVSDSGMRPLFALSPFPAVNSLSDGGVADRTGSVVPFAKRLRPSA